MKTFLRISMTLVALFGLFAYASAQGGPVLRKAQSEVQPTDCIDKAKADQSLQCGKVYKPVCGCDGNTYNNPCEAERRGLASYKEGTCSGSVHKEIENYVKAWQKAYNTADAKKVAAMFTPHSIFQSADGRVLEGEKAIAQSYAKSFEKVKAVVDIQITDILPVCETVAYVSGTYKLTGLVKANSEKVTEEGTYVSLAEKQDGQWQIVRHHTNPVWEGITPAPQNPKE